LTSVHAADAAVDRHEVKSAHFFRSEAGFVFHQRRFKPLERFRLIGRLEHLVGMVVQGHRRHAQHFFLTGRFEDRVQQIEPVHLSRHGPVHVGEAGMAQHFGDVVDGKLIGQGLQIEPTGALAAGRLLDPLLMQLILLKVIAGIPHVALLGFAVRPIPFFAKQMFHAPPPQGPHQCLLLFSSVCRPLDPRQVLPHRFEEVGHDMTQCAVVVARRFGESSRMELLRRQVFLRGLVDVVAEVVAEAGDFGPAVEAAAADPLAQGAQVFGRKLAEGAQEQAGGHGVQAEI